MIGPLEKAFGSSVSVHPNFEKDSRISLTNSIDIEVNNMTV